MIIFRHLRGLLVDSMKNEKEFKTFNDLRNYIVEYMKPYMDLVPEDVVPGKIPFNDERIGWENSDYLCIRGYNEVSDKKGFQTYFGGKYDFPLCVGVFATKYKNDSMLDKDC